MIITPEQLGFLKKLKVIDQSILAIQTEREEAPGLIDSLEKKVAEARTTKEKTNDHLEKLQLVQMQTEEDIENANERLKQANLKLQNISNDTEYKAATKEVVQIDEILNTKTLELPPIVDQVKLAKKELEAKELLLKTTEEARSACPADMNEIFKRLDDNLEGVNAERTAITIKVDKPMLALYEKALAERGGLALVAAEGGSCKGCKVKIRLQLYNQVLQGKLEECETCKRLLYAN